MPRLPMSLRKYGDRRRLRKPGLIRVVDRTASEGPAEYSTVLDDAVEISERFLRLFGSQVTNPALVQDLDVTFMSREHLIEVGNRLRESAGVEQPDAGKSRLVGPGGWVVPTVVTLRTIAKLIVGTTLEAAWHILAFTDRDSGTSSFLIVVSPGEGRLPSQALARDGVAGRATDCVEEGSKRSILRVEALRYPPIRSPG